jgi:hypothetical protein
MNERRGTLPDVIDTAQPKKESKTKKYIRMVVACIGFGLILLTFIMAYLRKYGS